MQKNIYGTPAPARHNRAGSTYDRVPAPPQLVLPRRCVSLYFGHDVIMAPGAPGYTYDALGAVIPDAPAKKTKAPRDRRRRKTVTDAPPSPSERDSGPLAIERRAFDGLDELPMYPLRFEPIFQYRPWGGRRLGKYLRTQLPGNGPVGEAWLLSDRDDFPSRVADGPLKGCTIKQLLRQSPKQMMGSLAGRFRRFPLLLKYLDAMELLSVQVHPSDSQTGCLPAGETGKTEAWVVLETGPKSCIYAGLKRGATAVDLRQALSNNTVVNHLASFAPDIGDGVLIRAGTVHSLGGLVAFEVQENSDVTFRLYDWNRVDPKTGLTRPLQVDNALDCINYSQGAVEPALPVIESSDGALRERLVLCEHFGLWRISGASPFSVGKTAAPRLIVCINGEGKLEYNREMYNLRWGDTLLLPAIVGECCFRPTGDVTVLEIAIPAG